MDFQSLAEEYERSWYRLEIRPMFAGDAWRLARKAVQGKNTYQQIEARTNVPWWFVALVHYYESNFDFDTYLGNGESLHRVTTVVPKGRGPFPSFVDGAIDALKIEGLTDKADWSVAKALFRLEARNGFGYRQRGVNSPYLYGGSTLYGPPEAPAGKLMRDGTFDPNMVDRQVGTAVVLRQLMDLDSSIELNVAAVATTETPPEASEAPEILASPASPDADQNEQLIDLVVSLIEATPDKAGEALDLVRKRLRSKGVKEVQEVFFGTNRRIDPSVPFGLSAITSDRETTLKFGCAWVGIPSLHLIGAVERPERTLWGVEEERPDEHFTILRLSNLSRADFIDALSSDHASALVFVHGYNTSFADAVFRAAQIAYDSNFSGKVVVFSWPSRAAIEDYDYDHDSATGAVGLLLSLLEDLKVKAGVQNVFLVAHSMGSQIAVAALQRAFFKQMSLNVRELILAAPDIDRDVFASNADELKQAAEGITIYASSADKALRVSKLKAGGIPRVGDVPEGGPLIIKGIDLIDMTAIGEDMLSLTLERGIFRKLAVKLRARFLNHSVFSSNRSALDDLGRIITGRERPPHKRTPTLERMPDRSAPPEYWRYPY